MEIKRKIIIILLIGLTSILFGRETVVKIQRGDTLYKISREYNISLSLLLGYNSIDNANSLKIGQEIRIPSSYSVVKGDTLYGISRNAGIGFNELCKINGIDKNHILKPGEILLLPVGKSLIAEKTEPDAISDTDSDKQNTEFFWPHSGERVSMIGKLKGEEILGKKGDEIVSVSTGKVVWVAPYRGYGRLIMVESPDNHIFAYGGNEETLVKVGDHVYPGTALGLMGVNSIERNAKAFFFVYKDGKPVDINKAPRG